MAPNNPKDEEIARKIAPAVEAFTQTMDDNGLMVSSLIFDENGTFLVRAGNAPHQGEAFVRLHYYLSLAISQLDLMGQRTDMSGFAAEAGTQSRVGREIALHLAQSCLMVPPELVPDRIRTLAAEYLDTAGA